MYVTAPMRAWMLIYGKLPATLNAGDWLIAEASTPGVSLRSIIIYARVYAREVLT